MRNKSVLAVSFYFPPAQSAGVQRVLSAVNAFEKNGWITHVLTANEGAFESLDPSNALPSGMAERVHRARAFDVFRHLSFKGKYLGWMAIIDRWSSWIPFAILKGKKVIEKTRPELIWSSSPIPSSHIVAGYLSKKYQIPWVADFRDPIGIHKPPMSKSKAHIFKWIDNFVMQNCHTAVFVSDLCREAYQREFPFKAPSAYVTIENGFSEENWTRAANYSPAVDNPLCQEKFSLLYSGVLYPNGRDPSNLFKALADLQEQGAISESNFELVFIGSGDGGAFCSLIRELGIESLVKFSPPVPYLDSLKIMQSAQGLVLIQDEIFRLQVPGKLYEYFRASKPILAITDEGSSTARAAQQAASTYVGHSSAEISAELVKMLTQPFEAESKESLMRFSRERKGQEMVQLFNKIVEPA